MVRQADDHTLLHCTQRRILNRPPRSFIDNGEDRFQRLPEGLILLPSRQQLRDWIQEGNGALSIGRDDPVTNARERDAQPLALFLQGFFGSLARRDVNVDF